MNLASLFWLAPAFPLVVLALLSVAGSHLRRSAGWISVVAVACSAVVSGLGLTMAVNGVRSSVAVTWLQAAPIRFPLSLLLDPLSTLMALIVSVIAGIVFWYSVFYMRDDPRTSRFFAEMSLFAGSMLALVISGDLITLFIAWELVGICSYLLIGFYSERPGAGPASTKALFITRLADLAMLAGILLLANAFRDITIHDLISVTRAGQVPVGLLTASMSLVAIGALGKSAQVPFQGWLPDAMAGPTPVSALLHSATMVAAGVFVISRLYPLFSATPFLLAAIAWVGVITSLLGGLAALVEADLKRLLAYSTMSQIGLMMTGLGAGSLLAGILLLVVHAFYKSCLFLIAGALDRAGAGTSLEEMRGIGRDLPILGWAMLVASVALAGLPASFALPPKDPVLAAAWTVSSPLFWAALAAGLLTAAYSGRMFAVIVEGERARHERAPNPVPAGLIIPTATLAILIMLTFLANARILGRPLERLLGLHAPESLLPAALSLGVAAIGFAAPIWAQSRRPTEVAWRFIRPLAPFFKSEIFLVPAYEAFSDVSLTLVVWSGWFDRNLFDRLADSISNVFRRIIGALAAFNENAVDRSIHWSASELISFSEIARKVQTGRIENYLLGIILWALVLVAVSVLS